MNPSMKILLISNMYPSSNFPSYGIFVKNFISSLQEKYNVEFSLCVIRGKRSTFFAKIITYLVFYFNIILKGLITKHDIIYVHYISHSSIPIILLNYLKKGTIIINAHGSDIISNNIINKIFSIPMNKLIEISKIIVVPSKYYKKVILDNYIVEEKKIFISPSGGINQSLFFPKNNHPTKTKILNIGFISRIDKGKGWNILLEAAHLLINKISIKLYIVGSGEEKDDMLSMLDKYELNNIVEYYGELPQETLVNIYHKIDVFVFPTMRDAESLGLVGLESMACGIPVISSDIAGPSEYVINDYNGFKFYKGDVKALAKRLLYFSNLDQNTINRLKNGALLTSEQYHSSLITKLLFNKLVEINSE